MYFPLNITPYCVSETYPAPVPRHCISDIKGELVSHRCSGTTMWSNRYRSYCRIPGFLSTARVRMRLPLGASAQSSVNTATIRTTQQLGIIPKKKEK